MAEGLEPDNLGSNKSKIDSTIPSDDITLKVDQLHAENESLRKYIVKIETRLNKELERRLESLEHRFNEGSI